MGIKLLVDIQPLLKRRTGVGNYIFYLLREIVQDERVEDVVGVAGWQFWQRDALQALLFAQENPFDSTVAPSANQLTNVVQRLPWKRELRAWLQAARLYWQWSRYRDYVFWGGNYYLPPVRGLRTVLTVHDLSHVHYPQFHPTERVAFLTQHLPATMQRADAMVAVSEATRRDIQTTFASLQLPPLTVVYPGAAIVTDPNPSTDVRERYQLPKQFILAVGTLEPRKNLTHLLQAYQQLPHELQQAWPLVLAGDKGWLSTEFAAQLQQQPQVRWLGFVPDTDMPGLYQAAGVFVYVSLFEGFGMPVLEAMQHGVPVLTSNTSSLPEVVGDAAILTDPLSVAAIAASLCSLLQDQALRKQLSVAGQARAQQFNWQESARRLLDVCASIDS